MSDNKNVKDKRDRSKVSTSQEYELSYLEKELGKSREEVKAAIAAVGNDRIKVEKYLKSK
jgi:hypothetical protein